MSLLDLIAPGKKNKQQSQKSTQTYLRIGEIRDNTLVLKNGGQRSILKVSSINFNLKSEQEQNAIISAYQGFLNSLEFPIQIVVRSKKLDIDDYIEQVRRLGDKQQNKLLQEQTYEYSEYIKKLVEYADIMEKEFYVVIPYDPLRSTGQSLFQSFIQHLTPKDSYSDVKKRHNEFNNLKKPLSYRVNIVKSGLENCGLKAEELTTQEIIELFYRTYNPKLSRTQKIKNLDDTNINEQEVED
ncbi:hypothetical protein COU74_03815 [Candidatus Peregrinibacteria bacterium CG10_big_fil_rev_8_21_14_0_10_36_19]|nr:MAG: hypothetical protein COU74_03815 [Candidatus Peregrinibacteria bacterium CG10_big_fil_rev_8_21_14_0_10_36_19]